MNHSLEELISLIDVPARTHCLKLLEEHTDKIHTAPGSLTKHQAWPGGYKAHVQEVMNIAQLLYEPMNKERSLSFSLSDALLVLFLHDIEKPFKYTSEDTILNTEEEKWKFLQQMVEKYNIPLTEEHWRALKYVHGEGNDYHPTQRIQYPLGAFVHVCDTISARIWYDYPHIK